MQDYLPILTCDQINKRFLFLFQYPSTLFLPILSDPVTSRIISLALCDLFDLNPFIFVAPGLELYVSNLIESREVKVVFELHADILTVVGILRVGEAVGFEEDVFHECLWDALVGHYVCGN